MTYKGGLERSSKSRDCDYDDNGQSGENADDAALTGDDGQVSESIYMCVYIMMSDSDWWEKDFER